MTLASLVDPVCGMRVDPENPKGGTHVHAGKTYGFCNPRCRERFAADPERYLAARAAGSLAGSGHEGHAHAVAHSPAVQPDSGHPSAAQNQPQSLPGIARAGPPVPWICPMDPEVSSDRPGPCPRCGMALEPKEPVIATATQWVCPMHPQIVRDAPGSCPDLRDGARAPDRHARGAAQPGARGHAAAAGRRGAVHRRAARAGDGRDGRLACSGVDRLGRAPAGDPGRGVGRRSLLRPRRRLDPEPQPEHVHPHRAGGGRGVRLQRRRHPRPGLVPRDLPWSRWPGGRLLRAGGGHRRAGARGPGARAPGARGDGRSSPGAARAPAPVRPPAGR